MNIAICDDLQSDINLLKKYIEKYCLNHYLDFKLSSFLTGETLWENFKKYNYEIIFLDIYMDGKTGMEVAHDIRKINKKCLIIFTTTSLEHAIESYEVEAIHYLIKPLTYNSVSKALDRCKKLCTLADQYIEVMSERIIVRIQLKDLIFAEIFSNVLIIHTVCKDIKTYMSLEKLEKLLEGDNFLRCHRSYIINMDFIKKLDNSIFVLNNNKRIPIRRQNKQKIKQQYANYLFNMIRGEHCDF